MTWQPISFWVSLVDRVIQTFSVESFHVTFFLIHILGQTLKFLDEIVNDDTLEYQCQFGRGESISNLDFALESSRTTVQALKIEDFD